MANIFLTGANGFIGSHIVEKLIKAGHNCKGLVRKTSDLSFISNFDIELVYGNLSDIDLLKKYIKDSDIVVHIAALASDWGPFKEFYDSNVIGTQNIAQAASESKVKRFVDISTTAMFGFGNLGLDENSPYRMTIFPYTETKRLAEEWLKEFSKSTDMEITYIKPGNVFGTRDRVFMEKYCKALIDGKVGYIGGGEKLTCPTYVENLADAVVKACFEPKAKGESFIITDGLDISWRDFTEKLADELKVKRPSFSIPFPIGYSIGFVWEMLYKLLNIKTAPLITRYRISNGGSNYTFKINKAKTILNWEPLIPFDEAIRRTVIWYYCSRKE